MTEHLTELDFHKISATVTKQGEQIYSVSNRLGRLEHEFADFAKDTGSSLKGIESTLAQLSANEPTGLMEIIKGAIILGVFMGTLIGGISYVVHAIGEPRIVLVEYQLKMAQRELDRQRVSSQMKTSRLD